MAFTRGILARCVWCQLKQCSPPVEQPLLLWLVEPPMKEKRKPTMEQNNMHETSQMQVLLSWRQRETMLKMSELCAEVCSFVAVAVTWFIHISHYFNCRDISQQAAYTITSFGPSLPFLYTTYPIHSNTSEFACLGNAWNPHWHWLVVKQRHTTFSRWCLQHHKP